MRFGLGKLVLATVLVLAASAGPVMAATNSPDHLTLSASTTTVSGKPVTVDVLLTDGTGQPVEGALIRLLTQVTFMGKAHDEIIDEGTTDADGKTVLTFAPTTTGAATITARYDGAMGSDPVEASLDFNVQAPVVAYHPTPVGLQAPWARSYFILLPVLAVWFVYMLVIAQASKIRRAGHRSPVV